MFTRDSARRTLLMLPDGNQLEWTATTEGIRRFKIPGYAYPYGFDIDGQRYRVEAIGEFPFLPGRDGSDGGPVLMLDLVAFGPPTN